MGRRRLRLPPSIATPPPIFVLPGRQTPRSNLLPGHFPHREKAGESNTPGRWSSDGFLGGPTARPCGGGKRERPGPDLFPQPESDEGGERGLDFGKRDVGWPGRIGGEGLLGGGPVRTKGVETVAVAAAWGAGEPEVPGAFAPEFPVGARAGAAHPGRIVGNFDAGRFAGLFRFPAARGQRDQKGAECFAGDACEGGSPNGVIADGAITDGVARGGSGAPTSISRTGQVGHSGALAVMEPDGGGAPVPADRVLAGLARPAFDRVAHDALTAAATIEGGAAGGPEKIGRHLGAGTFAREFRREAAVEIERPAFEVAAEMPDAGTVENQGGAERFGGGHGGEDLAASVGFPPPDLVGSQGQAEVMTCPAQRQKSSRLRTGCPA